MQQHHRWEQWRCILPGRRFSSFFVVVVNFSIFILRHGIENAWFDSHDRADEKHFACMRCCCLLDCCFKIWMMMNRHGHQVPSLVLVGCFWYRAIRTYTKMMSVKYVCMYMLILTLSLGVCMFDGWRRLITFVIFVRIVCSRKRWFVYHPNRFEYILCVFNYNRENVDFLSAQLALAHISNFIFRQSENHETCHCIWKCRRPNNRPTKQPNARTQMSEPLRANVYSVPETWISYIFAYNFVANHSACPCTARNNRRQSRKK